MATRRSASSAIVQIHIFYMGLASAEAHIERVRRRVSAGGHDIPDADIRRRYRHSLINLVTLLPVLTELQVYDHHLRGETLRFSRKGPQLR